MVTKRLVKRGEIVGRTLFPTGRVSAKGGVVIPKEIRDEMGLRPGDEVQFAVLPPLPNMKQDKALNVLQIIRVPEDPVALFTGMFRRKPGQASITRRLLDERRKEVAEEERKSHSGKRRRQAAP